MMFCFTDLLGSNTATLTEKEGKFVAEVITFVSSLFCGVSCLGLCVFGLSRSFT